MKIETTHIKSVLTRTSGYLEEVCSRIHSSLKGDMKLGASLCGVGCYVKHAGHLLQGREWGTFLDVRENAAESYLECYERESAWARKNRNGFVIFLSSATEPFPPQEKRFGVTRGVLNAMLEQPPDGLIVQTHSPGVLDVVETLVSLKLQCNLHVHLSIETDRERLPGLPPPASPVERRFHAAKALKDAGLHRDHGFTALADR